MLFIEQVRIMDVTLGQFRPYASTSATPRSRRKLKASKSTYEYRVARWNLRSRSVQQTNPGDGAGTSPP